jgi:hypothetical protein
MTDENDDEIQTEFQTAQRSWIHAVRSHRLAPPDADFSQRLAALAEAARLEAEICRRADRAGYEWPRHRAASDPPYELRPDSGRRGPEGLWQRFDAAVSELNRATGRDKIGRVADAYAAIATIARELSDAIERDDRKSGLFSDDHRRTA